MGFVTFKSIENLLPDSIKSKIAEPSQFAYYEGISAKLIRDITNMTIPANPVDAPDWILLPSAYIITKLVSARITGTSQETNDKIDRDYKEAISMLKNHRSNPVSDTIQFGTTGTIGKVVTW